MVAAPEAPMLLALTALLACSPDAPGSDDGSGTDDTAGDTSGDTSGDTGGDSGGEWPEGLAELTEPSGGACPDLSSSGAVTLTANGKEREVRLYLPESVAPGAPAMFVWHPLGMSARQIAQYMDLSEFAEATGLVIVVPEAKSDNQFEWDFWNGSDDDLVLFDDLRSCLVTELGVDAARITSHGMSAGGLMTTHLSIQRADSLATVSPFSGGTEPVVRWSTPAYPYPALVVFGGESDTYGSGASQVDFAETTANFVEELRENGQFVVLCDHGGGHTLPNETMDMIEAWNLTHRFGEPSPFADGDLSALPEWCAVVQ
jgi:poly(3-hydroxybutyrate) depolymerase